ncbi:MAG: isochorismatase [Deltaproteobacteria bacterium RBG_13_52_11]|nr:MAG: isochorismatase [Deltaproteobacteria bacterium RBG_13_52_11]
MRPAIIIVDMVKDNFREEDHFPITREAQPIIPQVNHLLQRGRRWGIPIIFACDSFLPDDFLFKGKLKPHSIRGTEGAEVTDLLEVQEGDVILPKRRFSAFFKTDLDQTLRTWHCDTVAVAGITTNVCVLMTAMDALCHDFSSVLLEDCCAAHKREVHETTLENYRKSALFPLFRIMTSEEFLRQVEASKEGGGGAGGA